MKSMLVSIDRYLAPLRNGALLLAGCGLFFMTAVCTADVVAYLLLGRPFPGASESVEVVLAITFAMTLAYTQQRREHVMVDIVVQRMSPRWLVVSSLISCSVSLFCMVILAWRSWTLAIESVGAREVSATILLFPIYPWKVLFALGITLAALEVLRQLIQWLIDPGEYARVHYEKQELEL